MLKFRIVSGLFLFLLIGAAVADYLYKVDALVYGTIVIGYLAISFYGSFTLSAEFFAPVFSSGARDSGSIAITFDDGPISGNTEKILAILKNYEAPAAFFCIGQRVAENQDLLRKIYADEHMIGNHSYWHKNTFDLQTMNAILSELTETDKIIRQTIHVQPKFFRPPYGVTNPMVGGAIRRGGYKVAGWSVRSFDTISKNPKALLRRVTENLKAGDIVLFHDYCGITIDILPQFIEYTHRIGLKIVRLDVLLNEQPYVA